MLTTRDYTVANKQVSTLLAGQYTKHFKRVACLILKRILLTVSNNYCPTHFSDGDLRSNLLKY